MPILFNGIQSPDFTYISAAGTALIKNAEGLLRGVFVSAASDTPTMKLFNDSSVGGTATTLVGTFTPVAATYYNFADSIFSTALYVVSAGTVRYTAFYF